MAERQCERAREERRREGLGRCPGGILSVRCLLITLCRNGPYSPDYFVCLRSSMPPSGGGQGEWDRRDRDRQQRQPQQFQRRQRDQGSGQQNQHQSDHRWERHWQRGRDERADGRSGPADEPRSRNRSTPSGERRMYSKDQLLSHYTPMRKCIHSQIAVTFQLVRSFLTHVVTQHAPGMRPSTLSPLQRLHRDLPIWLRFRKMKHHFSQAARRLGKDVISQRLLDAPAQAARLPVTTVEETCEDWAIGSSRTAAVDRRAALTLAEIMFPRTARGVGATEINIRSSNSNRILQEAYRTHRQVECGITKIQRARPVGHSRKRA